MTASPPSRPTTPVFSSSSSSFFTQKRQHKNHVFLQQASSKLFKAKTMTMIFTISIFIFSFVQCCCCCCANERSFSAFVTKNENFGYHNHHDQRRRQRRQQGQGQGGQFTSSAHDSTRLFLSLNNANNNTSSSSSTPSYQNIMMQSSPSRINYQQQQAQSDGDGSNNNARRRSPFPTMPSTVFLSLAHSQFELLANSLLHPQSSSTTTTTTTTDANNKSKIKSMALYLPQENIHTGQLEFLPAVIYPNPTSERVFVASAVGSGLPPTIPQTLTKLPGFANAQSLLPAYPFTSGVKGGGAAGVGAVEEVMCDVGQKQQQQAGAALSVPLFRGSQTVGVLIVWPSPPPMENTSSKNKPKKNHHHHQQQQQRPKIVQGPWSTRDKEQISRAANSLSMALLMDNERNAARIQTDQFRVALADNLHQVKNPVQALRTFGKLLERKIAMNYVVANSTDGGGTNSNAGSGNGRMIGNTPQLLELAENMMVQSERVVDLLHPMDSLVASLEQQQGQQQKEEEEAYLNSMKLLGPYQPPVEQKALMLRQSSSSSKDLSSDSKQETQQQNSGKIKENEKKRKQMEQIKNASTNKKEETTATASSMEFTRGQRKGVVRRTNKNQTSKTTSKRIPKRQKQPNVNEKEGVSPFLQPPPTKQEQQQQPPITHPSQQLGDLDIEMAFVPDVLEPIISASKLIATERNIDFQVIGMNDENEELPGVSLCPKSLQEAVANILDNAIKYVCVGKDGRDVVEGNPNPQIKVVFKPNDKQFKSGVTIYVEDNGPGIPPSEREAVFERGYRGDATRLLPGSGIGLDISRSLLSRMGGMLDVVENEEGHLDGAVVRLILFRDP